MGYVNLDAAVDQVITTFSQNRGGKKPSVSTTIPAEIARVAWPDGRLKDLVRVFLYNCFSTSDPSTAIEITLRKQVQLRDLEDFVGVHPSYWTQLRASGRGLRMMERLVEELFDGMGYRCEEWVGVEASGSRLGIFAAVGSPNLKMVFCLEWRRAVVICDLLLPISKTYPVSAVLNHDGKNATR
jgi:hypothetical protein